VPFPPGMPSAWGSPWYEAELQRWLHAVETAAPGAPTRRRQMGSFGEVFLAAQSLDLIVPPLKKKKKIIPK